jgi:hypothetical protein
MQPKLQSKQTLPIIIKVYADPITTHELLIYEQTVVTVTYTQTVQFKTQPNNDHVLRQKPETGLFQCNRLYQPHRTRFKVILVARSMLGTVA